MNPTNRNYYECFYILVYSNRYYDITPNSSANNISNEMKKSIKGFQKTLNKAQIVDFKDSILKRNF